MASAASRAAACAAASAAKARSSRFLACSTLFVSGLPLFRLPVPCRPRPLERGGFLEVHAAGERVDGF